MTNRNKKFDREKLVKTLEFAKLRQKIRAEREKIFIPKACTECSMRSACESCPASCYAENGKFLALCTVKDGFVKSVRAFFGEAAK